MFGATTIWPSQRTNRNFIYLKAHHNAEMVFDPSEPEISESEFPDNDGSTSEFGSELKEILPGNMHQPRGQGVTMRCIVDADHGSDNITRRLRTGFVAYLNTASKSKQQSKQAPLVWNSLR